MLKVSILDFSLKTPNQKIQLHLPGVSELSITMPYFFLQILSGIYPIAQVREPYTAVGYLAERVPLVSLLSLRHPDADTTRPDLRDNVDREWSAMDVCDGGYKIDGLVWDCSISIANASEILESCTKPSKWYLTLVMLNLRKHKNIFI